MIRHRVTSDPSGVPEVDSWVIESDRLTRVDDIPAGADVQVDYSPYVVGGTPDQLDYSAVARQGEIFIGYKQSASS